MSESVNTAAQGSPLVQGTSYRVEIVAIGCGESIKEAAARMLSHNVGCLIVNDEQGDFVGLVTERDIARYLALSPDSGAGIRITQIMTGRVISGAPGIATSEARRIMTDHRIRHLPLVENGKVVGILSARDIMSRQILEDRAAAEEVAMLSKCLKSIDLSEAAEIVVTEAPKLFDARSAVLCLYRADDPGEGKNGAPKEGKNEGRKERRNEESPGVLPSDVPPFLPSSSNTPGFLPSPAGREPELICSNRCPCLTGHLKGPRGVENVPSENTCCDATIPPECLEGGGKPPRVVLPLDILGLPEAGSGREKRLRGYLCMCGLPESSLRNKELTQYKAKLMREILVAHLTNATRYQQARLTSLTDPLTGVGSRKLLEDKLCEESDRAQRYQRPFSVAIIDLDHFKMINDSLGHAIGDEAIRQVAACVKQAKRGPDVLARYGGDEFVLLLPETKAEDAAALLERIRAKVREIRFFKEEGKNEETPNTRPSGASTCSSSSSGTGLSISCGIAESHLDTDSQTADVMRRADMALYEAKNAGRNCVKLWDQKMVRLLNSSDIEIERIKKLQRRIMGLSEKAETLFMESIWSLVQALEAKDMYARKHSENVMVYAVGIARTMELGPKYVDLIHRSAMIHDIGKIGIPDAILFKPDELSAHERRVVEQHPLIAVRILEKMSFLENEIAIVRHHHEKWNGHGYPDGLARAAIPLGARILAVADTFDALTSTRAYHASRSVAEVLAMLEDSSGYEFDPTVVTAMVAWVEAIIRQCGRSVEHLAVADLLAAHEGPAVPEPAQSDRRLVAAGVMDEHEQARTVASVGVRENP